MTWGLAYIIANSDVQRRMHEELDRVIGSDRMITVSDKPQLPYTNAVVMEIQRCANIVSTNLPRKASRDVELNNGVVVKQGTIILPQISVINIDPNVSISFISFCQVFRFSKTRKNSIPQDTSTKMGISSQRKALFRFP
jgi:hypothetical protein